MPRTPQPKEFVIRQVGPDQETTSGNRYVVCETDLGRVAVWGSATNLRNIEEVHKLTLPARVRAGCIPSNWSAHSLWVPEPSDLRVVRGTDARGYVGGQDTGDKEGARQTGFDPYEVLGVRRGATPDEIRAAYRARIKEYHPDQVERLGPELRNLAKKKTQEINRAFEVLSRAAR